jgi:DNA polymerase-3 subunit alpha
MSFVHLHVHSCYSLLDGAIKIPDLLATAEAMGMPAVALTDHGQMYGIWAFKQAAAKSPVKPIFGVEAYVTNKRLKDRDSNESRHHLVLLAKNYEGYRNLCRLVSIANIEGFYNKPRMDLELLAERHEGLIALSGCLQGEIPRALLSGRADLARSAAERLAGIFGDDFFLELQENGIVAQAIVNQGLASLAQEMGLPLVATNDCHYLKKEHHAAHDALLCIQTGKKINDSQRMRMETDQFYFKSPQEMAEAFAWRPDALENTLAIADLCDVEFPKPTFYFPAPPVKDGTDLDEFFVDSAREGLTRRLAELDRRGRGPDPERRGEYDQRLEHEIAIILKMRFPGYFLIVADFIAWAKSRSIPVGPGRGSAVGSLVAWALGITDIDPIRYDLLFERFLNPERVSLPDIDVDFCAEGRGEVIRYVTETYGGGDYVAQIVTMGQMKARAVVRDVGRVLGLPLPLVDAAAKKIPDKLGITLAEALEAAPALKEIGAAGQGAEKLLPYALLLENLPRHASIHASGVVVSDRPLMEILPLCRDAKASEEAGRKAQAVTQYELKGVEDNGLIKFDFLGLKTLTLIKHCLRLLGERGVPIDLDDIDLKDPATFELLAQGDLTGVFQLESRGIRDVVMRFKPSSIEDIIALVALYRPGPLNSGMVDTYIKVKHGLLRPDYPLESLKPILEETLGVIVYQEQVMRIAQVLAGYSLGEADLLRRAMGKKKPEEMERQRSRFLSGAIDNGVPADKAESIFQLMAEFAEYGFNKSHSAAYALITYRTAWLKAHYPTVFMAALMTSERDKQDKLGAILAECRLRGIPVRPPDVNTSDSQFTVVGDQILFGLSGIKGVGQAAVESVIEARLERPFEDLYDFCQRTAGGKVNKRVVESLINCGAMDDCGSIPRERQLAALDNAMDVGAKSRKRKQAPPANSLFAEVKPPPRRERQWPQATPLTEVERLGHERDLLGFYVSGHPLDRYHAAMAALRTCPLSEFPRLADKSRAILCGTVARIQQRIDRNGKPYAFLTIEDANGKAEAILWSNVLARCGDILEEGRLVTIQGQVKNSEADEKYGPKIIADDVKEFERSLDAWTGSVTINASLADLDGLIGFLADKTRARGLKRISPKRTSWTDPDPSLARIFLTITDGLGRAVYRLTDGIRLDPELFRDLARHLSLSGDQAVSCSTSPNPFPGG